MEKSDVPQNSILPRWLNEKEVAAATGLSVHTLRAYRQQHKGIPYVKLGKAVRYAEADVNEFMRAHRITF